MRWNQDIASFAVVGALLSSGCEQKGELGGCVVGSGPLAECGTTFCSPLSHRVVINDLDGGAAQTGSLFGAGYVGLSYDAPDAHIYLSFAQSNGIRAAFQYFWIEVYFTPDQDGGRGNRLYNQSRAFWGSERWERFEIVDGRLKGTFKYEAEDAHQMFQSRSPDCVSGDILGECFCSYEPLLIPVAVDVDIALPP